MFFKPNPDDGSEIPQAPVETAPELVETPPVEPVEPPAIVPEAAKHTLVGDVCQFCGTGVICPINGQPKSIE